MTVFVHRRNTHVGVGICYEPLLSVRLDVFLKRLAMARIGSKGHDVTGVNKD